MHVPQMQTFEWKTVANIPSLSTEESSVSNVYVSSQHRLIYIIRFKGCRIFYCINVPQWIQ